MLVLSLSSSPSAHPVPSARADTRRSTAQRSTKRNDVREEPVLVQTFKTGSVYRSCPRGPSTDPIGLIPPRLPLALRDEGLRDTCYRYPTHIRPGTCNETSPRAVCVCSAVLERSGIRHNSLPVCDNTRGALEAIFGLLEATREIREE